MYQPKFDIAAATPLAEPIADVGATGMRLDTRDRVLSVMVVLGLPLILLGLLARLLWKDVRAIGSVIANFHRDAADELSRP
jgi:hypothetical protein